MERLLTIDEVADITRLSKATLYTLRTRGGGPVAVKFGGRIAYRPSDVEAWIDSRLQARTPSPDWAA